MASMGAKTPYFPHLGKRVCLISIPLLFLTYASRESAPHGSHHDSNPIVIMGYNFKKLY